MRIDLVLTMPHRPDKTLSPRGSSPLDATRVLGPCRRSQRAASSTRPTRPDRVLRVHHGLARTLPRQGRTRRTANRAGKTGHDHPDSRGRRLRHRYLRQGGVACHRAGQGAQVAPRFGWLRTLGDHSMAAPWSTLRQFRMAIEQDATRATKRGDDEQRHFSRSRNRGASAAEPRAVFGSSPKSRK